MRQKRMRMELGGFALIAMLVCGMIAVFLLGKDKTMPTGPLASQDCRKWVAQTNTSNDPYLKDSSRLIQSLPDSNFTVTLETAQSPQVREFWYTKLASSQFLAISTTSFGRLPASSTLSGAAGLNEASMRISNLQYEGEWTIHYDEASKPVLTAKVRDLGTATCKSDGCFFSVKENVQALPLEGQPEVITAMKAQDYFGEKLQPVREACTGIRDSAFRTSFDEQVAKFQAACGLTNLSEVATLTVADEACQTIESTIFPIANKY